MSLTYGRSPFGPERGHFDFGPVPDHVRYWEPWPRRMRAMLNGETILDSRRGVIFYETGELAVYYFPVEDVRQDLLVPSELESTSQEAGRWSLRVGDRFVKDCITSSPRAADGSPLLGDHVTVEYAAMDWWFEEDDSIYAHPRDPYHRVDVRSASSHMVVRHAGEVVAESDRPKLLFETSLPVRYYLPFDDIRIDLLVKSEMVSECPYKGDGQHWHLRVGADEVVDAAWNLPHPLPEGLAAAGHVCFYPDKVEIEVDDTRVRD